MFYVFFCIFVLFIRRDGQNHHTLVILKSKSNHLNKDDLKSKSRSFWKWWFENQNHIGNQMILKYSLNSSNSDVFCLLTAYTWLPVTRWVSNTINVFFFQFKCFCFNSTQVIQLFRWKWLIFSLSAPREKN